jgi:hypothetical protein
MASYPYPATENYPNDTAHLAYLQKYDTRSIENQTSNMLTQSANRANDAVKALEFSAFYVALATVLASALTLFAYKKQKKRKKRNAGTIST